MINKTHIPLLDSNRNWCLLVFFLAFLRGKRKRKTPPWLLEGFNNLNFLVWLSRLQVSSLRAFTNFSSVPLSLTKWRWGQEVRPAKPVNIKEDTNNKLNLSFISLIINSFLSFPFVFFYSFHPLVEMASMYLAERNIFIFPLF